MHRRSPTSYQCPPLTGSWYQCLPEALIVYDPTEGSILFANDLAGSLLDYAPSELAGKCVMELDLHIPTLFAWQVHASALKHNGRVLTKSLYRKKTGEMIPVEIASIFCHELSECVVCIVNDVSPHTAQTEKISISLQEKEHLLKEIHHRVKNNLQTISSLLSLGSKKIKDDAVLNVLQESQNRIHAIATVHELLYRSDMAGRVDMSKYLKFLVTSLMDSFGSLASDIRVTFAIEKLFLLMDTAMPCGLIVNELVTNSIQHAFGGHVGDKRIEVSLARHSEGAIVLEMRDNGCGFDDANGQGNSSVGLKLVKILAKQLDGVLNIESTEGTVFRIVFYASEVVGEERER